MKKINVIDLDKTLVPYDSLRKILLENISFSVLGMKIIFIIFIRKCRLIDSKKFKEKINTLIYHEKKPQELKEFGIKLFKDIDPKIIKLINKNCDSHTENIIVSASLDIYVRELAGQLGWSCIASHHNDKSGTFINVFGQEKINQLLLNYPQKKYLYNFAVSDSKTDIELLKMFRKSELLK